MVRALSLPTRQWGLPTQVWGITLLGTVLTLAAAAPGVGRSVPTPVVVDVDAGVDDALALALLLAAEERRELTVRAITTVSGNTGLHNATRNVVRLLYTAGRMDIPVYVGTSHALDVEPARDFFFGSDGFGDVPPGPVPPPDPRDVVRPEHAVHALIRLSKQEPDLVMLCLAPLTNLAMATRMDPDFPGRLAHVIVMGGAAEGMGNVRPGVEFNFYWDPLAASIVLSEKLRRPLTLVTWETATRAGIPMAWRREAFSEMRGSVMLLLDRAEQKALAKSNDTWISADLVAASMLVQPGLGQRVSRALTVEVHASRLGGASAVDYLAPAANHNAEVVTAVDVEGYKKLLVSYLGSLQQGGKSVVGNTGVGGNSIGGAGVGGSNGGAWGANRVGGSNGGAWGANNRPGGVGGNNIGGAGVGGSNGVAWGANRPGSVGGNSVGGFKPGTLASATWGRKKMTNNLGK